MCLVQFWELWRNIITREKNGLVSQVDICLFQHLFIKSDSETWLLDLYKINPILNMSIFQYRDLKKEDGFVYVVQKVEFKILVYKSLLGMVDFC